MSRKPGFHHSSDTRVKMSIVQKGRKIDSAIYEKRCGKIRTEETKEKMSISQQIRWAKESEHDKVSGKNSKFWKGGRYEGKSGYIQASKGFEHRFVMEKYLGRHLLSTEVVHHINRDKSDNGIENLILFSSQAKHLKYHKETY